MPKNPIDYSKCMMYKIICKDSSITECYVGNTTNFIKRKAQHKYSSKTSNSKFYQLVRSNGGFDNWTMVFIENYPCSNTLEARMRENELYIQLCASLNSNRPYRTNEQKLERNRQHYSENCEKILNYQKQYRDVNKDKISNYQKQYSEANRDKILEKQMKYRTTNKDQILEKQRKHYADNREIILEKCRKRYADKITKRNEVSFDDEEKSK